MSWDYAVMVYWLKLLDRELEHMANVKVEGCQTGLYLSTEEIYFPEYNAMFSDSQLTFHRNISPPYWVWRESQARSHMKQPSSRASHMLKNIGLSSLYNPVFLHTWFALLAGCLMLVSCLAYYSTMKMYAICSSKKSVDFHQTIWHYVPEDRILHSHHCENLKSKYLSEYKGDMSHVA
jgi:hypothetical protein